MSVCVVCEVSCLCVCVCRQHTRHEYIANAKGPNSEVCTRVPRARRHCTSPYRQPWKAINTGIYRTRVYVFTCAPPQTPFFTLVVRSFIHFTGRCSTASRTTRTGTTFSVSSLLSAACSQPCLVRARAGLGLKLGLGLGLGLASSNDLTYCA